MLKKTLVTTLLGLSLVGCGGKAENDSDPGSGGAATGGKPAVGGTSSTGGSASGGASSGGSGGTSSGGAATGGASTGGAPAGGTGGAPCVPNPSGGGGTFEQPTCDDLSVMDVTDPSVTDAGGDGKLSSGESFEVHAKLVEIAGEGFMMYPGVRFSSDNEAVTIKADDWFYGIFACGSYDVTASGQVSASVAPGTVVVLTAQVGMLNDECPNAPSIQIPITIH